jgi:predicted dehydrogenase
LCEKPLALTLEEVDEMSKASRETGKILMEAFMYRHHPQTIKVKEMVDRGELGKIQFIRGSYTYTMVREGNYRMIKEMGGGSLWDVGCYPISYARLIVGAEPVEVFGWQVEGPGGFEQTFVGQMRFPNNVMFQFDSSFKSPLRATMEIVGTDASLSIPAPFKPNLSSKLILTDGDRAKTMRIKGEELYGGEVENMVDAVLSDKPPRVTLEDSRGNIAAILALLESAGRGKPFPL